MQVPAALLIVLALLLSACAQEQSTDTPATHGTTATPPETTAAPTAAPPTVSPAESPTATPGDQPSLPPFGCGALPVEDEGEVDLANISDVRVGTHDGYDRVVFEFQAYAGEAPGVPHHLLRRAEPPLQMTPSGQPMEVEGDVFVQLTLLGGTTLTGEFEQTYEGPRMFEPDFQELVALAEAGDFEATADWYIGLADEPCLRVFALDDPPRLVIDVEHD